MKQYFMQHQSLYLEVRNGVMMAFLQDKELATAKEIAMLFDLARRFKEEYLQQV